MGNKSSLLHQQCLKIMPPEWHDLLTQLFRQAYTDGYQDGQQDLTDDLDEEDDDDLH